jgi:hypothetical protein
MMGCGGADGRAGDTHRVKEGSAFILKGQAVFVEKSETLLQEHGVTFQKT